MAQIDNKQLIELLSTYFVRRGSSVSGNETIAGVKTFSSIPVLPASDPTTDNQAVRKAYVDNYVKTYVGNNATKVYVGSYTKVGFVANGWNKVYHYTGITSNGLFAINGDYSACAYEVLAVKAVDGDYFQFLASGGVSGAAFRCNWMIIAL